MRILILFMLVIFGCSSPTKDAGVEQGVLLSDLQGLMAKTLNTIDSLESGTIGKEVGRKNLKFYKTKSDSLINLLTDDNKKIYREQYEKRYNEMLNNIASKKNR